MQVQEEMQGPLQVQEGCILMDLNALSCVYVNQGKYT